LKIHALSEFSEVESLLDEKGRKHRWANEDPPVPRTKSLDKLE